MKLKLLLVPVLALAGLLGVSSIANAGPSALAPQSYTVNVGGGGSGIAANQFFPTTITIHKGDSIHFVNPYEELHTVTYVTGTQDVPELIIPAPSGPGVILNPLATKPTNTSAQAAEFDPNAYYNSGLVMKGQSADIHFNVASDTANPPAAPQSEAAFKFICLFHPGMQINVKVTSQTIDLPTQADIDKTAMAQRDALITAGTAIANGVQAAKVTSASGAVTQDLLAGSGLGQTDVMQFLPAGPTKIKVGDTVRWTSPVFTPHTVTFLSGAAAPPIIVPVGDALGISPAVILPSGGSTYDGTGIANSGFIDVTGQVPGGSSYSLTFTKAGTYTYICQLHADQGMAGTIVVGAAAGASTAPVAPPPRTGTIVAPNTGFGPDGGSGNGSWTLSLLMLGVAGAALVLAGTRQLAKRDA